MSFRAERKYIMVLWLLLAILIIVFDQAVKLWVINNIGATDSIKAIPGVIDFVNVKNTGAAFSFLSEKSYGILILSIVSVLFCIGVVIYVIKKRPKNKLLMFSLSLMLAGALGNAIDRIARGFVIDFIETKFISFPVFNIADISITVGAVLLIIYVLFFETGKSKE